MLKGKWPEITLQYLLCVLAFLIPFPYIFSAICIGIILILWLLSVNYKDLVVNLSKRRVIWAWMVYFLLHVISYSYSSNKAQSAFDLQSKLSIFFLPVVIGAGIKLTRRTIERIFFYFNISVTVIGLYCIYHAAERTLNEGYIYKPFFFYNDLVDGLDASAVYMAWYTLISMSAMFFIDWKYYYQKNYKWLKILLLIFQIIFFILLSARTLLLVFFIVVVPFYVYITFKHTRLQLWQKLSAGGIFLVLAIALLASNNPVKKRFGDLYQKNLDIAWQKDYSHVPQKEFSNLTLRLMVWRMGIENMNEHHLWLTGAGNGDVQDLQNQKMAAYGIDVYNPDVSKRSEFYNLNLHNMALESLMMLGIPGLILFLFIIFAPFFLIRKIELKNIFILFNVIAFSFFFQEAAFQTQAGIVYYTFFTAVLINIYYTHSDRELDEPEQIMLIKTKNI